MSSTIVLDASAFVAVANNERGAAALQQVIEAGLAVTTSVTLAEAAAVVAVKRDRDVASVMRHLTSMVTDVIAVEREDADRVADLICQSRRLSQQRGSSKTLSLGDAVCIAVAERLGANLVGGDNHWAELDLSVEFLPFR